MYSSVTNPSPGRGGLFDAKACVVKPFAARRLFQEAGEQEHATPSRPACSGIASA
jgi:hypothetical protein